MSMQALRERKQSLAKEANNLLANAGDKVWSKEDQAAYDLKLDEIERVSAQISAHQKALDADAEKIVAAAEKDVKSGKAKEVSINDIVSLYLRKGDKVSAEEALSIRNAMSTTTGSEGGFTVPTEIAKTVIDALKAFGGMRNVASIITTAAGNDWQYPGSDGTSEVGEIVGQNAAATTGEITFSQVPLVVYKYSSKKLALPWELVQDSGIDIVSFVVDRLATRLGRINNTHFTVGTGTAQPFGIVTRATSGKVGTTGQTLTVIYDDLVDLEHSVDTAYRARPGVGYMMNDLSVRNIRKIKDTQGRPIFVPGYDVAGAGAPDTLMGRRIDVNQDVPVMAANARSILFGDLSSYTIRDVMQVEIRRFDDSAFALNGQVGFCGWNRTGGNLLDTAAVKFYQNSAT
jgi:HK97 family phage major capsid protein